MSASCGEVLEALLQAGTLTAWTHVDAWNRNLGVVVGRSERLVVFQAVADTLAIDGYAAVPLACLGSVRASASSTSTLRYLASQGKVVAAPAGLEDVDVRGVLQSLAGEVVAVRPRDDDVVWVGTFTLTGDAVRVHTLDTGGRPMRDEVLALDAVGMVEWGTAYLAAVRWMGADDDGEDDGPPWYAEADPEALVPPTVGLVPAAGDSSTYAQAMAAHAADDEPGMIAGMRTASAEGDPRAIYALATWSLDGSYGADLDPDAAGEGLRVAAEAGVVEAMWDRALWLEDRSGPRAEVFRGYLRAALRGDKGSVTQVARCFEEGVGVPPDPRAAAVWWELARDGLPRPPRKLRGTATDPSRGSDGSPDMRLNVLLSVHGALLGEVFPALRYVAVTWSAKSVEIRAYVDGPPAEDDLESLSCAHTQVIADFPADVAVDWEVIRCDAPERIRDHGVTVYLRREDLS